jgi:uncharacterized membrane protein
MRNRYVKRRVAIMATEQGLEHGRHCAMRVEESVEINRPLQEVFNYVSDVGNYPEWMAHVLEVRRDTPRPTAAERSVRRRHRVRWSPLRNTVRLGGVPERL